jgi:hypothetical protein
MSYDAAQPEIVNDQYVEAVRANVEHQQELAATAMGIDQRRVKEGKIKLNRFSALSRGKRHRALDSKVRAAGVRSAAGLKPRR